MAQDLSNISIEAFTMQIAIMSSKSLVSLSKSIRDHLHKSCDKMHIDAICDMERKDTKIQKELLRRKYLTKKDFLDFNTLMLGKRPKAKR